MVLVDIVNNKIIRNKEKKKCFMNFYYYKNNKLIGISNNNIVSYDFNSDQMTNLLSIDSAGINVKYIKDEIFYYVTNQKLYTYDILNNILLEKKTYNVGLNKLYILDITDNINIISLGIQRCVCFYGINNDRTKCFIVHVAPDFNDIDTMFNDIINKCGEEYTKMNINIVGGFKDNKSFNYLLNKLSLSFNMLHHTLKPYNIIISKNETLIF